MGIGDRDVKWDTHDQVVTKIMAAENYIRIKVATPIKSWVNNRSGGSESVSLSFRESSSNIIKLFPSSSSRTSLSSLSSNNSDYSYNSGSEAVGTLRKKRSWAVFKIKDQM